MSNSFSVRPLTLAHWEDPFSVGSECARDKDGQFVIDVFVKIGALAKGRGPDAEETGVERRESAEGFAERRRVAQDEVVEFRVTLGDRVAPEGHDAFDLGIQKAFPKDALTDHAGGAKEGDVHRTPLAGPGRRRKIKNPRTQV